MRSLTMIAAMVIIIGSWVLPCPAGAQETEVMTEKQFTLRQIGTVHKAKAHTTLVLNKDSEPALQGLDGFSHVWVLYWFDRNDTPKKRSILQVYPRGNKKNPLTGVFACRAPVRPNLIGLSLCRVLSIQENVVEIDEIDAFHNTPVLDLKPYIPSCDSAEASFPSWLKKCTRARKKSNNPGNGRR